MKSIFIIIFFLSLVCLSNAQSVVLHTPNGTPVHAEIPVEFSPDRIVRMTDSIAIGWPNAYILEPASNTYNCHSYAWNMIEGGPACYFEYFAVGAGVSVGAGLNTYWDDGSYVETNEANAVKIFYYDGDHSAVKSTTHAGEYESKWGQFPLVRHAPNYGPFDNMNNRRYYRLAASTVCTPIVNYAGKIVDASNTIVVSCGDINVENVTVANGKTLTIKSTTGNINVENVHVTNNSRLVLDAGGKVSLGAGFRVDLCS